MSWLRLFEAYRELEAQKMAADARAMFLQYQVTTLQARLDTVDARAQEAMANLLADRQAVADMFAARVMGEGVFDPSRQPPAPKSQTPQKPLGPQRVPAYVVARQMTQQAFAEDAARIRAEAEQLQHTAEAALGIKLSSTESEVSPDAQAPTG